MKLLFITAIFLFVSATGNAQGADEIRAIQLKYDKAIEQKDAATLQQLFHDNMIITGGDGTRRGKQQEIADCVDPRYNVIYFKTLNTEVDVLEHTAILRGDLEWQMKQDDNPITLKRRMTFTYAKVKGQWVIVAQHIGMMPR